ncbi:helix-turn-helix domain-containing protein [Bacillus tuaregi]|uniref:helix-turn-helix domain-containing protein n=1 Tax=Bacillus tuaregi TaxID=1816695 RepID=UPI0008F8FDA6|nr:helix-turn-helix domain-containing protein [Bacillus tuaregi]
MYKLNFETIKNYQSFSTIEEMDQAVRGFLYKFKSSLSDGAMKVLKYLWNYSVKVVGVSFSKYDTMAATIGLSRRTVIRAVKMLEELLFIKKIPTSRMNGKQGVNLFVIQPFAAIDSLLANVSPQDVTQPVTPNKAENKQSSLCENKKQNRIFENEVDVDNTVREMEFESSTVCDFAAAGENSPVEQKAELTPGEEQQQNGKSSAAVQSHVQLESVQWHQFDPSYLPSYVNKDFIKAAQPFFHAGDIHKIWSKVHLAYRKVKLEARLDEVMETIIADFKQTVFLYKTGKIHTTFEGYFYSVIYRTLWHLKVQENHQQWYENVMNRY